MEWDMSRHSASVTLASHHEQELEIGFPLAVSAVETGNGAEPQTFRKRPRYRKAKLDKDKAVTWRLIFHRKESHEI
ncbi:hypothetical protein LJK87_14850 [Paenibacillus sp. P25]|nr:hypothetical protein LJK87_14850 [Paenibacillus sp. P25]